MPDRVNAAGYSIFTGRAGGGRQVLPKRFTACVETSGSCEYTLLPPSISRVFLSVNEAKFWLGAVELMDSISRHSRWLNKEVSYFENDASFLSYRNSLGRHCGRAAEAAHAATPIRFAQSMVKREAELYTKLKHRNYDNSWGGKSAPRNAWISSMKDYAFDIETAREGLLTLEGAFVELSGTFASENGGGDERTGKEILDDPVARNDIELESIERVPGIWNSKASRAIFLEIVKCEYF